MTDLQAIASRAPLLTIKDVRERIHVSASTIYLWMSKGKFPKPLQLGEACVRWREEDLAAWLEAKKPSL